MSDVVHYKLVYVHEQTKLKTLHQLTSSCFLPQVVVHLISLQELQVVQEVERYYTIAMVPITFMNLPQDWQIYHKYGKNHGLYPAS